MKNRFCSHVEIKKILPFSNHDRVPTGVGTSKIAKFLAPTRVGARHRFFRILHENYTSQNMKIVFFFAVLRPGMPPVMLRVFTCKDRHRYSRERASERVVCRGDGLSMHCQHSEDHRSSRESWSDGREVHRHHPEDPDG